MQPDGTYIRFRDTPGAQAGKPFNAQQFLMELAEGKTSVENIPAENLWAAPPAARGKRAPHPPAKKAVHRKPAKE